MKVYFTDRKTYKSGYCWLFSFVDETDKKSFYEWLKFIKENVILQDCLEYKDVKYEA